ncbi:hypothetical protein Prudu_002555 [Prunus dulcis]|uniref:NAC domain-containing protein n=1 Tax=Prunus dulcis TaxID=3755 RepID=A0A4Y1QR58_PRUDU|nr:hypothetical protein Prudu_002555 [Prunus dulcis]
MSKKLRAKNKQTDRTKLLPQLTNSNSNSNSNPHQSSVFEDRKRKKEADVDLPTGYRFDPSEDEIVVYYLFNKILDRELPITDVIKEISVYDHDPDELPNGDFKHGCDCNEAFYFTYTEQIYSSEGKITRRTTRVIERYMVCRIIHEGISNYQPTFKLPPGWTARPVDEGEPN